jgi:hypothetical protein
MKFIFATILILLVVNSYSDLEEDCICTEEYRTYLVAVVDSLGFPVDS